MMVLHLTTTIGTPMSQITMGLLSIVLRFGHTQEATALGPGMMYLVILPTNSVVRNLVLLFLAYTCIFES